MQKYKLALVLYSSAIGVFYGATAASAAPFRTWAHNFVAQKASAVTQLVSSSRDFELKSGASISAAPIIFDSGKLDPIIVQAQGNQRDNPTDNDFLDAASDLPEPSLGSFIFNSSDRNFASSSPSNDGSASDARDGSPIRFVIPNGNVFPNNDPRHKKPKSDPDIIADNDPDTLSPPSPPVLHISDPFIEPIIGEIPKDLLSPPGALPVGGAPFSPPNAGPSFGSVQTIPEAATLALLGLGVAGLGFIRHRPAKR